MTDRGSQTVIAIYSLRKAIPMAFLLLGFIGAWLWMGSIVFTDPDLFGSSWMFSYIGGSILFAGLFPGILGFFRQLLFKGQTAVWIADGQLIYIAPSFFRIPCADIAEMDYEEFGPYGYDGVAIVRKDGRKKILPCTLLTDDADVVVARLRKVCNGSDVRAVHAQPMRGG